MIENKYMISSGNRYIGLKFINNRHDYYITENREDAYEWGKSISAENVLKELRKKRGLLGVNINKECYRVIENTRQKEVKVNSMKDYIEKTSDLNYIDINEKSLNIELDELLNILYDLENKLINNKSKYENDLIKVSKALTDITHFKEFNPKRSASERCKLDVFETNVLLKRRKLKNDILKIECALERLKGKKIEPNIGKRYEVRILNNLFETNTIPNFEKWWEKNYE